MPLPAPVTNQTFLMVVPSYSAFTPARYSSSLTFSIQSTVLPSRRSRMAICVMAVLAVAPCQCFSSAGLECDTDAERARQIGCLEQRVDTYRAGKILLRPSAGRL